MNTRTLSSLLLLCGIAALPASAATVTLTWNDNSTAEQGFKIERSAASNGPWTQIGTTSANIKSYADTTAANGATYYYRVKAYTSTWNSGYTNVAAKTVVPGAPTGVTATAGSVGTKKITLNWAATSGATGYKIFRAPSSTGTYAQIATATGTTYANTGLTAGTTYYYKIAATNATGTGAQSASVSAKAQ